MGAPAASLETTGAGSARLAAEALALGARLTPRDLAQLRRLLLDHFACAWRGSHLPWGRRLQAWARRNAAPGPARIFPGGRRVAPAAAAFVNATAAHGLELDDTHDESVSHPGAAVIAGALAVAQAEGAGGRELAAAITAGYEVVGRLGAASNAAAVIERGFHPTCLFAGFGAAAAAAVLMGLDGRTLQQAWGLMLSMAGGSMQFSQEAEGTTVKRLHGGLAALHGVMAAELAAEGIAGPEQALDGRYGLAPIFGAGQDLARLVAPHRDGPEIHRVSFKPYPCCRLFHSTLDALQEVTDEFALGAGQVARITVGGPEILVTQHMLRRPGSEMAAQYSLPFTLGAAFRHGPRSVDGFAPAALGDPEILAVADRVRAVPDAAMEAAFPRHFGSWLELETASGEIRRAEVLDSLGTPARPMSLDDLAAKFDALVLPTGLTLTASALVGRLAALETAATVDALLELFCGRPED